MQLSRFRIAFDVLVLGFFAYIWIASLEFRSLAGYFPGTIAGIAFVLGLVNLGVDVVRFRRFGTVVGADEDSSASIHESDDPAERRRRSLRMLRYVGWIVGFVALIWVFGMIVAAPVFLLAFFLLDARTGVPFAVIATVIATATLVLATDVMGLRWPTSLVTLL